MRVTVTLTSRELSRCFFVLYYLMSGRAWSCWHSNWNRAGV